MFKWRSLLVAMLLIVAPLAACSSEPAATSGEGEGSDEAASASLLDTVSSRGSLICGVNGQLPGFSFVDESGEYSGLDVDYCRAIAAALFDDPEAVEYRNLSAQERFTAVQAGEVDILIRNTTWTISRDTSVGMEFAPTTFYDGQGMMVPTETGFESLEDMQGASICVQSGTTTELNLTDQMRKRGVDFSPVVFDDEDALYAAYAEGRCEGATSDRSQLIARRTTLPNPDGHVILDVVMSKEPLGPTVANGDSRWFDAVKWVTFATIQAEEFGITSENIGEFETTEDPNIARFLGQEGTLGSDMGLPNDFAARVIRHVGNYAEIYERNVGEPFDLERGPNMLWTEGGLLYSPPFR